MGKVVLITGGCRSGKSGYAQRMVENAGEVRTFVATCPVLDGEMQARIERHRADRLGRDWTTVETPLALADAIAKAPAGGILIDCLTLWIGNLMHERGDDYRKLAEDDVTALLEPVLQAARAHEGVTVLVTNEVGLGIVPANGMARHFRDLAGRCNQTVAAAADEVVLMVSGLPMVVKPNQRAVSVVAESGQ